MSNELEPSLHSDLNYTALEMEIFCTLGFDTPVREQNAS